VLSHQDYVVGKATEVNEFAAEKFLDLDSTAKQAGKVAFGAYRNWIIAAATVLAAFLALIAIFAPLGASIVQKWVDDRRATAVQGELERSIQELQQEVTALKAAQEAKAK
jgi:hypothetical protein